MTRRYDFDYWPPLPLEQEPVPPYYDTADLELCEDLLQIEDPELHQAVYATGEWLDIQDFWLEAKPPQTAALVTDPELCNLTAHGEQTQRVADKRHLNHATYVFRQVAYEVAELAHIVESPDDAAEIDLDESHTFQLLSGYFFNRNDRTSNQEDLLIHRGFVDEIYDNWHLAPWGLAEESRLLVAKVALKWSVDVEAFNAGLIDLRKPQ